jgi:hypothetical protein
MATAMLTGCASVPDWKHVQRKFSTAKLTGECKPDSEAIARWARTQKTRSPYPGKDGNPKTGWLKCGTVMVDTVSNVSRSVITDGHQVVWIEECGIVYFLDYNIKHGLFRRKDIEDLYRDGNLPRAQEITDVLKQRYNVTMTTPQDARKAWGI